MMFSSNSPSTEKQKYLSLGRDYCTNLRKAEKDGAKYTRTLFTNYTREQDFCFMQGMMRVVRKNTSSGEFTHAAQPISSGLAARILGKFRSLITQHKFTKEEIAQIQNLQEVMNFLVPIADELPRITSKTPVNAKQKKHIKSENINLSPITLISQQPKLDSKEARQKYLSQLEKRRERIVKSKQQHTDAKGEKRKLNELKIDNEPSDDITPQSEHQFGQSFSMFKRPKLNTTDPDDIAPDVAKKQCEDELVKLIQNEFDALNPPSKCSI